MSTKTSKRFATITASRINQSWLRASGINQSWCTQFNKENKLSFCNQSIVTSIWKFFKVKLCFGIPKRRKFLSKQPCFLCFFLQNLRNSMNRFERNIFFVGYLLYTLKRFKRRRWKQAFVILPSLKDIRLVVDKKLHSYYWTHCLIKKKY